MSDLPETAATHPKVASLLRLLHWMYALQAIGLGLAMLFAWTRVGVVFVGWPAILAMLLHRREKKAALAFPLIASHFDWLNRSFWTSVIWLGTLVLLYFTLVGTFFNGALVLVGLFGTLRLGYGWLMLCYGTPARRKPARAPADEHIS